MQHERLTVWNFGRWTGRRFELDFLELGTGIIRLAGPNESGKTTLFDALNPYNEPLRRRNYRCYCNDGKGGLEHVFTFNGARYKRIFVQERRVKASGDFTYPSPTVELWKNGKLIAKGTKDYKKAITAELGPSEQFYAVAVQAQRSMRNAAGTGDFVDADPKDRELMFKRILGLDAYERIQATCHARAATAGEGIDKLRGVREDVEKTALEMDERRAALAALEATATTAADARDEATAALASARTDLEAAREGERVTALRVALNTELGTRAEAVSTFEEAGTTATTATHAQDEAIKDAEAASKALREAELAAAGAVASREAYDAQQKRAADARKRADAAKTEADAARHEVDSLAARAARAEADLAALVEAHPGLVTAEQAAVAAMREAEKAVTGGEAELERLESEGHKARTARETASGELGEAIRAHDAAGATLAAAETALKLARRGVDRVKSLPFGDKCVDAKCALLGDAAADAKGFDACTADEQAARAALEAAAETVQEARAGDEQASAAYDKAQQEYSAASLALKKARVAVQVARETATTASRARSDNDAAQTGTKVGRPTPEAIARADAQATRTREASEVAETDAQRERAAADAMPEPEANRLEAVKRATTANTAAQQTLRTARDECQRARAALAAAKATLDGKRAVEAIVADLDANPEPTDVSTVPSAQAAIGRAQARLQEASEAASAAHGEVDKKKGALENMAAWMDKMAGNIATLETLETERRRWTWLKLELGRLVQLKVEQSGPQVSHYVNALLEAAYGARFRVRVEPATKNATNDATQRTYNVWIHDSSPPRGLRPGEALLEEFSGAAQNMLGQSLLAGLRLFAVQVSDWRIQTTLLDEADAAMDPETRGTWQQMLRRYLDISEEGMTVILTTHADSGIDCDAEIDLGALVGEPCGTDRKEAA